MQKALSRAEPLNEEPAALARRRRKDLPTEPFDPPSFRVLPLQDRHSPPPSIVLPTPSWAPPSTRQVTPHSLKGAEALSGHASSVEDQLGQCIVSRCPSGAPS